MEPMSFNEKYMVLFQKTTQANIEAKFGMEVANESLISNVNIVPFIDDECVVIRLENGNWEIPGGTLEKGEHYQETVRRELMEEAGAILHHYRPFGGWKCFSQRAQPYKPHLPYPKFFRLVGYGDVELISKPQIPDIGGEKVVSVEVLSVYAAAERFRQIGREDIAELYLLAEELRNQHGSC